MINNIIVLIIFSFIIFSCDTNKTVKSVTKKEITNPVIQQNRFCFIYDFREDSLGYILIINQIDYKNDSVPNVKKIIELPSGYYFSDDENKLETLQIDSSTEIKMQTFSFNDDGNFNFNQKVNISDLVEVFKDLSNERFKHIPFRMVATGTKVDSLFEIYIP